MKFIITEEQNLKLRFMRRYNEIIEFIKDCYSYHNPCEYSNYESFLYGLEVDYLDSFIANWLHSDDENELWDIIIENFGDELRTHYYNKCGKIKY